MQVELFRDIIETAQAARDEQERVGFFLVLSMITMRVIQFLKKS